MGNQRVPIGSITGSSDIRQNLTRESEFVAEERRSRSGYGSGRDGGITDSQGVTKTLYRPSARRPLHHPAG